MQLLPVHNCHCQVFCVNILWLFIVSDRKAENGVTCLWPPSPNLFNRCLQMVEICRRLCLKGWLNLASEPPTKATGVTAGTQPLCLLSSNLTPPPCPTGDRKLTQTQGQLLESPRDMTAANLSFPYALVLLGSNTNLPAVSPWLFLLFSSFPARLCSPPCQVLALVSEWPPSCRTVSSTLSCRSSYLAGWTDDLRGPSRSGRG